MFVRTACVQPCVVGCTSIDVKIDVDPTVDLSRFKTFASTGLTDLSNLQNTTEENIDLGNKAVKKVFENYPPSATKQ